MALESSIQESILDYINSLPYGRAENVSGNAAQSGRADINACVDGMMLKIEVKTEDTEYGRKGMTTKQRLYLEKWARAGAISCVVYSVEDVKWVLKNFIYSAKLSDVKVIHHEKGVSFVYEPKTNEFNLSGRGKWYDVQNKRWVDISY